MIIRKYNFLRILMVTLVGLSLSLSPFVDAKTDNTYSNRLYTPTFITKISGLYFIVDCWNHRIIYSRNIDLPIRDWKILDDNIAGPHSIAGNGEVFVAEDTGRNQLFVYTLTPNGFVKTQIIDKIEGRPHRTIYDPSTKEFYVLTSERQTMYTFTNNEGEISLKNKVKLDYLGTSYVRSFSIIDGKFYFVSGPNKISVASYTNNQFSLIEQFDVPEAYQSMNDIKKIGSYYYMTVYPEKIIRLRDLSDFSEVENIYDKMGFKGTPYYISYFDGNIYITEIDSYSGIKSFKAAGDVIGPIKTLNDSGPPDQIVINRKNEIVT